MTVRVGIIGGTGLGNALARDVAGDDMRTHDPQRIRTPFGEPSSAILTGRYASAEIAFLKRHGEAHDFNPAAVPYRANIYALKQLGCTHILASGAVGSLREAIAPGDVVLCDQFIDRTSASRRPRTFYETPAVHVEFADPVCAVMRQWLNHAGENLDTTVHPRGTYICIEGPSFSTRAESHMHRQWGADVVGMTAMPEARLAREAEMAYALIALPTDYDCWRDREAASMEQADTNPESLIAEIKANLDRSVAASTELIKAALADTRPLEHTASPAHSALDLAIWTSKDRISADEIERLRVLWGRHFA